ncbi:MAG: DUF1871 family protein [Bacillota bacterium]|nr:DUF1871 family protein [Bacillota bacterium]MDP4169934.1 DUF1871 family protein [Bacillota bacterium]
MEMPQLHLQMTDALNAWDPFHIGYGRYETEIADTIQAVHVMDTPVALAEQIQSIYEFSFEELIPMASCLEMAEELLLIKSSGSCTI